MSRRGKLTKESLFVTIICFNASQRVILQVIVFVVFEQFFGIPTRPSRFGFVYDLDVCGKMVFERRVR